ncbi:hypothetical protein NBRC116188_05530 [Oceaniserpentilla sp. 4NH20-0058]|uniref:polysaccharide deacetylase family protein n=1 Tax=Oceaniserpentilla sp. 4NH20-0058 TaxID=3127660 RepID=UPI003107B148
METKPVYLSFDIEVVVSKRSKNTESIITVVAGAMEIARLLEDRKLKGTFFVSLSSKDKSIDRDEYLSRVKFLIKSLSQFQHIEIQPHLHCHNLPMSFVSESDNFNDYTSQQQLQMLTWAKDVMAECGVSVTGFRAGGYKTDAKYYDVLKQAGYKYSSTLDQTLVPDIDLITGNCDRKPVVKEIDGIKEVNVTSVKVKSIKPGVTEVVNLSPDFFTIESVQPYFKALDFINVNFHSFSMLSNRLARENHKNQFSLNLRYMLLEKPFNQIARKLDLHTYQLNTVFAKELIKWLDEFQSSEYKTCFYCEQVNV